MADQELFSHFACVLRVSDMTASIAFYTEQLGFNLTFAWNEPIDYAVLKRGTISIHLSKAEKEVQPPEGISMYIFVQDVNAVYKTCQDKAVPISAPLARRDYGMSDFDIKDPDGYLICFGQESIHPQ